MLPRISSPWQIAHRFKPTSPRRQTDHCLQYRINRKLKVDSLASHAEPKRKTLLCRPGQYAASAVTEEGVHIIWDWEEVVRRIEHRVSLLLLRYRTFILPPFCDLSFNLISLPYLLSCPPAMCCRKPSLLAIFAFVLRRIIQICSRSGMLDCLPLLNILWIILST